MITREPRRLTAVPGFWPVIILAVSFSVRMLPVAAADFPLNDGGLFFQMSLDIQANGYALPEYTTFNGGEIPFAYPPLGFYVAAALSDVLGLDLIDTYQYLPPLVSGLVPLLVFLLLRALLQSVRLAAVAALVYSLLPGSFEWQIAGGGMTRSFGTLFMVAALWQATMMYRTMRWRHVWATAGCAGLTVLSHVGYAFDLAVLAALLFLYLGRSRRGVHRSVVVVAGMALVVTPWLLTVVARHGLDPFVHASTTSGSGAGGAWSALLFRFGQEPFLSFGVVLGVVGLFLALDRGWWLLLAWALVVPLLDARQGPQVALIPLAAGAAVTFQSLASRIGKANPGFVLLVVYVGLAMGIGAVIYPTNSRMLDHVPETDRRLMSSMRDQSEKDAKYLILSGEDVSTSAVMEWFPALTGRESITTAQGREWLPDFAQAFESAREMTNCYLSSLDCVERVAAERGLTFDHVYVLGTHMDSTGMVYRPQMLLDDLASSPDYALVRAEGDSSVWARQN